VPLVPVTFTLYVAAKPLQERIELPEDPMITLLGVTLQLSPELGKIVVVRTAVPE
jgi:hypothetical protein